MTTHMAANWKGRPGITTGNCAKWAMRPPTGAMVTTTEKEKVTCTRCAKQLGIVAAPKPVAKNLGTCPCCFRSQKTLVGRYMVHHGYQRPGYGYIVGDCFGVKYPRFEDSCEGTVAYRTAIQAQLDRNEEHLTFLKSGNVKSLTFSYEVYKLDEQGNRIRTYSRYGMYEKKTVMVEVVAGAKEIYGFNNPTIPSFDELLSNRIQEWETGRKMMTRHIAELTEAIKGWKKIEEAA
jgi:hypothetical protein